MTHRSGKIPGLAEFVDEQDVVSLLRMNILVLVGIGVFGLIGFAIFRDDAWAHLAQNTLLLFGTSLGVFVLLRRRRILLAAYTLFLAYSVILIYAAWNGAGVQGTTFSLFVLLVLLASLFIGRRAGYATALAASLVGLVLLLAGRAGWLVNLNRPSSDLVTLINLSASFFIAAHLVRLVLKQIERALVRIQDELNDRIRMEAEVRRLNCELEQRVAERTMQLSASEERYRNFVENSTEGIWLLAFDEPISTSLPPEEQVRHIQSRSYVAECNDALAKMYGYDAREKFIGKRLLPDLYGRQASEENTRSTLKLVRDGYRSTERITEEVNDQGERIYFLNNAVGMIKDNHLVGIWGIQRDITELKNIDQAMTRRAMELRALYEASIEINEQPDVPSLLQVTVRRAATLLSVHSSGLYLVRPNQTLELVAQHNLPSHFLGTQLQFGEGLAGKSAQEGKPIMVQDYETWDGRARIYNEIPARRTLSVPLRIRNRVIGALNVIDTLHPGTFNEDEIHLLSLFADQAAIAVENAQLLEQAKERAQQLATLNEIGRAITTLRDLDSVLEIIHQEAKRVVPLDVFYISLYDAEQDQISYPIMYDEGKRYVEPTRPLRSGEWLSYIVHENKPLIVHHTPEEMAMPMQYGLGDQKHKSASALVVPLNSGNRVIGGLSAQSYTLNAYTQEHLQILVGIAQQAAIAIENAKLFSSAQAELSERKRVEQEREALIKELESKNTELERFGYTVSHDLKSPLITIQGFLGFVEQDAQAGNMERLKSDIARIHEATRKMMRLLNELLELSRIGRVINATEDVPFNQIVREAIELVRGRLDAKNVRVSVAEDLPIVHGERIRLVQLVQNLVDNACKFLGDQSEPFVEIGMRGNDLEGKPIFFVRDNGIGIAPKHHERVFNLFNKLDVQTEGTGIGLALVKRIIDVHGGRVWVESEGAGQGSTFCFTLPLAPAQR